MSKSYVGIARRYCLLVVVIARWKTLMRDSLSLSPIIPEFAAIMPNDARSSVVWLVRSPADENSTHADKALSPFDFATKLELECAIYIVLSLLRYFLIVS